MSKVENFNKRKGIVDGRGLAESIMNVADDIEKMVVVSVKKDGEITIAYTSGSLIEKIGLLEVGKQNLMIELGEYV